MSDTDRLTKAVILAGGRGTRMSTDSVPKPLTRIGDRSILEHVLLSLHASGIEECLVATGRSGDQVRTHFETRDLPIPVRFIDTGAATNTGGRLKRMRPFVGDRAFLATWCDGLHDIDIPEQFSLHKSHDGLATAAVVHPRSQYGVLELDGDRITRAREKPILEDQWIDAGVYVLEPEALDYVADDRSDWSGDTMPVLASNNHVWGYRHAGFWQCMDTAKDAELLNHMWQQGKRPWADGR